MKRFLLLMILVISVVSCAGNSAAEQLSLLDPPGWSIGSYSLAASSSGLIEGSGYQLDITEHDCIVTTGDYAPQSLSAQLSESDSEIVMQTSDNNVWRIIYTYPENNSDYAAELIFRKTPIGIDWIQIYDGKTDIQYFSRID